MTCQSSSSACRDRVVKDGDRVGHRTRMSSTGDLKGLEVAHAAVDWWQAFGRVYFCTLRKLVIYCRKVTQILTPICGPVVSQTGYSISPHLILAHSAGMLWLSNGTLLQMSIYNTTLKPHMSLTPWVQCKPWHWKALGQQIRENPKMLISGWLGHTGLTT